MRAAVLLVVALVAQAAQPATLRIEVRAEGSPVAAASVVVGGRGHSTDASGTVTLAVSEGEHRIEVS